MQCSKCAEHAATLFTVHVQMGFEKLCQVWTNNRQQGRQQDTLVSILLDIHDEFAVKKVATMWPLCMRGNPVGFECM